MLDELQAVNSMLLAIHESPVETLEDTGLDDAALALSTLRQVSRAVQAAGWHFNIRRRVELAPDANTKEIVLPHNCMRADTAGCHAFINVKQQGRKLFNISRNTFEFESPVVVDMVLLLPFDDLIEPAKDYIMIRATRRFQAGRMGSEVIEAFTIREEIQAKAVLEQSELENADYNILTDNPLSRYTVRRDRGI